MTIAFELANCFPILITCPALVIAYFGASMRVFKFPPVMVSFSMPMSRLLSFTRGSHFDDMVMSFNGPWLVKTNRPGSKLSLNHLEFSNRHIPGQILLRHRQIYEFTDTSLIIHIFAVVGMIPSNYTWEIMKFKLISKHFIIQCKFIHCI